MKVTFCNACRRLLDRAPVPWSLLLCRYSHDLDREGFAKFLDEFHAELLSYCETKCKRHFVAPDDATELTADSVAKMIRALNEKRYRCDRVAIAWAKLIIKRTVIDRALREGRCPHLVLTSFRDDEDERSPVRHPITSRAYRPDDVAMLNEAFECLRPAERYAVEGRMAGLSDEQLAAEMDRSTNAVAILFSTAKKKITEFLQ